MNSKLQLNNLREIISFLFLALAAASFPFSEALVSIFPGFLLATGLFLTSWEHPSVKSRNPKFLFALFSVFLVYVIGAFFTRNLDLTLYEFKKVVFWIVFPSAIFLAPRLSERKFFLLLIIFCSAVFFAGLLIVVKLLFPDVFGITDFRKVTFVSHIRFSFQVILALIILVYFYMTNYFKFSTTYKGTLIVVIAAMVGLLFLIKSIIGITALIGTTIVFVFFRIREVKKPAQKYALGVTLLLLMVIPAGYVTHIVHDFFTTDQVSPENVERVTPSGNNYHFDFEAGEKENGHWVFLYLCEDELRNEWNKISNIGYDDTLQHGYPLSSILIRYLTSYGYRKDSVGVAKLTADDIRLIEKGVTNHRFTNRFLSIYPRVYETIWELDHYFRTGNPNNQSLSQRIEFARASLLIFQKNPFFGIGTGNWRSAFDKAYDEMNSRLKPENRAASHNQYLNYMVKFGAIGFLWIMFAILFPYFSGKHNRNFIFTYFIISMAIANLGDSNLESHMGLSFFTFFYSLFLWHSPGVLTRKESIG